MPTDDKKQWTIMVYMAGDNDLNEDMVKRLIEMRSIFDKPANRIRTQKIGLCAYFDGDNPMIVTKQFNFTKGISGFSSGNLSRGNNSANPLTIKEFVSWCVNIQGVTAENYALFLSGHGDGFQQTSFLKDTGSSEFMTIKGLKKILGEINAEILHSQKLNLLGFDSCVMNTIEVANEFKDVAELIVGSQGYLPTTGWSYENIVNNLISLDSQSKIGKEDIAAAVVSAATESNKQYSELTKRSLDMSVYEPSETKFAAVLTAIDDLAQTLQNAIKSQPNPELESIKRKPVKKVLLAAHWKCQGFLFDQSVDIIDFCENLRAECFGTMFQIGTTLKYAGIELIDVTLDGNENISEVDIFSDISVEDKEKYTDVLETLETLKEIARVSLVLSKKVDDCILKCCFSGPDFQFSNGLSLFFPWSKTTLDMVKPKMDDLNFKSSKWLEFLKDYLVETCRPTRQLILENKMTLLGYKLLADKSMFAEFAGRVMVNPPPKGLVDANSQYKDYFMRTKNFSLEDVNFCPK